MMLVKAVFRAWRASRRTGSLFYVVHDGVTWRVGDECEIDKLYPDAPGFSVGGRR